jgi:hypothetical protein
VPLTTALLSMRLQRPALQGATNLRAAREHRARPSADRARHQDRQNAPRFCSYTFTLFIVCARFVIAGSLCLARACAAAKLSVCRLQLIHQLICAAVEQVEECKHRRVRRQAMAR